LKSDAPNAARRKAERGARSAPQRSAHRLVDLLILPAVILAGLVLRFARRTGLHRLPLTRRALLRIGVLPILDHYYEPRFRYDAPLPDAPRSLPGIRWNDAAQLALLERLTHAPELVDGQLPARGPRRFAYENGYFGPGDAEFLYSAIRHFRPARIMEVGSGHSTLVAAAAIDRNRADDPSYDCRHVCIEPYEHDWLEALGVEVVRRPGQPRLRDHRRTPLPVAPPPRAPRARVPRVRPRRRPPRARIVLDPADRGRRVARGATLFGARALRSLFGAAALRSGHGQGIVLKMPKGSY
jgi:hypothetical protein